MTDRVGPAPHVLLVEDEAEIAEFMRGALEDEGFEVSEAADGQQAVDLAAARRPAIVVLDMMLPRLNGEVVAQRVQEIHGNVPILVVTADGHAEEKARRVGAFAYLHKPFDVRRFVELVHLGLSGGSA